MKTVKDIIHGKSQDLDELSVRPFDRVSKALEKMTEKKLLSMAVVDSGKLVGIIDEKKCIEELLVRRDSALELLVYEIMNTSAIYVTYDFDIDECFRIMIHKHLQQIPVILENQFKGFITLEEISSSLFSEKDFLISNLTQYIAGIGMTEENFCKKNYQCRELVINNNWNFIEESKKEKTDQFSFDRDDLTASVCFSRK